MSKMTDEVIKKTMIRALKLALEVESEASPALHPLHRFDPVAICILAVKIFDSMHIGSDLPQFD